MSNDRKIAIAELVCRALSDLKDPQGSTESQIRDYIEKKIKKHDIPIRKINRKSIATALKTGVQFGLISKKHGKYELTHLVDNIVVLAKLRNKKKLKGKEPIRRVRTPTITKARPRPRYNKRHTKQSSPEQEPICCENRNYDQAFDDDDFEDENDHVKKQVGNNKKTKLSDEIGNKLKNQINENDKDSKTSTSNDDEDPQETHTGDYNNDENYDSGDDDYDY